MAGTGKTDVINIGLIILAAVLALLLPFHLFLFVYAFLGPLHYLTEINWLHRRGYFTTHRRDYLWILALLAAISVLTFTRTAFRAYIPVLTFIAFGVSLGFVAFSNVRKKILFALAVCISGIALWLIYRPHFTLLFYVLLPSVVHVFIFTSAFMLVGALKAKSGAGLVAITVFGMCTIVLLALPTASPYPATPSIADNYRGFLSMNRALVGMFGINPAITTAPANGFAPEDIALYFSSAGIRVMRFIAFAYTYHYLNWFSKTSVIQWHKTSRMSLIIIFGVWILSAALYLYDYRTGLRWLYVLSLGHVLLEFPLNHRSFIDLKNQLALRLKNIR